MLYTDAQKLKKEIDDLAFKINTTPRWLGKFIYIKLKGKAEEKYRAETTRRMRLNLCFDHRQESNFGHYSPGNCDYCQAIKVGPLSQSYKPKTLKADS